MMPSFLSPVPLLAGGPKGLAHSLERCLWHLGFTDVRFVDGRDDGGADILAERDGQQWVIQSKWSSRQAIDRSGVDDCERAKVRYGADHCVLATNATLNGPARARRDRLGQVGVRVDVWEGATLQALFDRMPIGVPTRPTPRDYQREAIEALIEDLDSRGRALLVLATGLGKTVVGGEVIREYLDRKPGARILVVAHMKELVEQLERALWKHLPKTVPTQVLHDQSKPPGFEGLTCATVESALGLIKGGYAPDLIMVDETHHVSAKGMYQELLDLCDGSDQFGVTATPWRGDKYDVAERFGDASYSLGIEEGMRRGYLAQVDYKLYVDNVDWDFVRSMSTNGYSVRDLNTKLFLPQRDEVVVDQLRDVWRRVSNPRALVFCQSIEHAERMARMLAQADPVWHRASALHSDVPPQQRQILLNAFRLGRAPLLTSVDVFNEGVDVPDVNIIAFLRVTHSRRIFVQQLGRGLRLRAGKDRLVALDFVSDVRRVAALSRLRKSLAVADEAESLTLPLAGGNRIQFNDEAVESLLQAWIKDAADLETAADEVRLQFPEVPAGVD